MPRGDPAHLHSPYGSGPAKYRRGWRGFTRVEPNTYLRHHSSWVHIGARVVIVFKCFWVSFSPEFAVTDIGRKKGATSGEGNSYRALH